MQDKTWYSILGVDAEPLSIKNLLLNGGLKKAQGKSLDAIWGEIDLEESAL